jgi:hypothetical protein
MHRSESFTCSADLANVRRICTSDECPMSKLLHAMPSLCEPPPPLCHAKAQAEDPRATMELADFASVKAYPDSVWGPARWTSLESEILSLPEEIDQHEFCMFKTYLALSARYLPCGNCSRHFAEHLASMPNNKEIRTRAGLLKWLTMVHNDVNRRKQREPLSHDDIINVLKQKAATTHTNNSSSSSHTLATSQKKKTQDQLSVTGPETLALGVALLGIVAAFVWFALRKKKKNHNV